MNAHALKILRATKLLALLLLLALPAVAQAQYYYTNSYGIWEYTPKTGPLTIEGYTGSGGVVVMPSTINSYPVTSIGNYAFQYISSITSMTIGTNVTSIGEQAFDGCTSLISVRIPNSVISIGEQAFGYCYDLASVTIGTNVTSIGQVAFYDCTSLTSVTIPNSVTNLGLGAFESCSNMTSVSIGNGVTYLGDLVFALCTSLTSVTIPTNVTSIGGDGLYGYGGPFFECAKLTSITIPDSVTSIGEYAFNYCTGLISVTIPDSVTNIGLAFYSCTSLTSVTIGTNVTSIASYAFAYCSSLTGVYFQGNSPTPNNDTSVFYGDNNGVVYYLPGTTGWGTTFDGLPTMMSGQSNYGDFTWTTNSGAITITGYTGSSATMTIPSTINGYPVTSIGDNAFEHLTSLITVIIPYGVTSIGEQAFYLCHSLNSVTIPDSVTNIGIAAFNFCSSLPSITIPSSVTSIGQQAFYYCTSLTGVTIGTNVTNIGYEAFFNCTSLTNITIPDSVTNIGNYAFEDCTSLTSVTIPPSVTSIGSWVFEGCTSLTGVTLPASVTSIGSSAFEDCTSLTGVYFQGNSPTPTNDLTVFSGDSHGVVYYLSATTGWGATFDGLPTMMSGQSNYADFTYTTNSGAITITGYTGSGGAVTIPSTINGYPVTSIRNYAFAGSSLTSVTIDTNVTSIGDGAFLYCTSLTAINVDPGNASYISVDGVLFDLDQTTLIEYPAAKAGLSYTIPASVTTIWNYAFYYCTSLSSVTIPASVTSIGEYAFGGCTGLTRIAIPASVTSIGEYAFVDCGSLPSITIGSGVTNIGDYAFDGCISLTGVYFQGNSPTPTNDLTVFSGDDNGVVYYLQGTTGWGTTFDGLTVMARANISVVLTTLHSFQVFTNGEWPTAGLVQGSDGNFYGTTAYGGTNGAGTVFRISSNGVLTTLYSFSGGNDGANPASGLVQGSDGNFYGTTYFGGTSGPGIQGYGTVFKISTNGVLATLYSFGTMQQFGNPVDGADPYGGLVQGSDGYFYGTTDNGGINQFGTVFKISATGALTSLYSFYYSDGANPLAKLVQGSDGYFYGTTDNGGANGNGTVFKISATGAFTSLYSFIIGNDAGPPESALVEGSDGYIYGTAYYGGNIDYNGSDGYGVVFKISTTGVLTNLYSFTGGNDGQYPIGGLVQGGDGYFYGETETGGTNFGGTMFKISTNGVLTTLYAFNGEGEPNGGLVRGSDGYFYGTDYGLDVGGTVFKISATGTLAWMYSFTGTIDGASPEAALVQGSYGYFYGTTYGGDSGSDPQTYGTVFKINTNGAFASLHSFTGHDGGDGGRSKAALVQGSDGNFYGTTVMGGTNGGGTVFKISANGVLTTLYSFTGSNDGSSPWAGLVQGSDGYFYGTTLMGTVFKISATGTLAWVYKFSGSDGAIPVAALVQGSDGNFYGTTSGGGTNGFGTVFKISATGTLTSLYSFTGRNYDGGNPEAGLVEGSDGYFYGTTSTGGTNDGGTVFKISTNGALTYLYSFTGGADGAAPFAGLVQGSDGYFYGTTSIGGSKNGWSGGAGTVFRISTKGVLTTLYSFTGGDDGGNPVAGLVQGSDGSFYGTTQNNGEGGGGGVFSYDHGPGGTVFRLTLGSGPASGSLVVSTSSLPNGTNGIAYSQTLSASGGKTPYTWTTSLGALPRGLTLAANGVLSGTPMTYGTFNFTVQVTDALSATATQSLVLQIMPQPAMGITTSGNQILLSWPTNAAGYILQSTTNLSSGIWSDVTSGITVVDTNYVFTSTPNGNAAFFRLKQ